MCHWEATSEQTIRGDEGVSMQGMCSRRTFRAKEQLVQRPWGRNVPGISGTARRQIWLGES